MAIRIASTTIPDDKRAEIALTYIFGIGRSKANDILKVAKVDPDMRIKSLSEEKINEIRSIIEKQHQVEGDLKREILGNIKRLKEINSYRGLRHIKKLPVRGQRTKTNNRTVRGNRRVTMGSGRSKAAQKT